MQWDDIGTWRNVFSQRVVRLSIRGEANEQADGLIDTLGLPDGGDYGTNTDLAQEFTTRVNPGGYRLTSVDIRMATNPAPADNAVPVPTVTIHKDSPTGTTVATLTGPSEPASTVGELVRSTPTFTAPPGVVLEESTTCSLRVRGDQQLRAHDPHDDPAN